MSKKDKASPCVAFLCDSQRGEPYGEPKVCGQSPGSVVHDHSADAGMPSSHPPVLACHRYVAPPDVPRVVTLTLTPMEAAALRAWLEVTEPEPCGADDEHHDPDGFAIPDDVADFHAGYCPGDIAALDRIAQELDRQADR